MKPIRAVVLALAALALLGPSGLAGRLADDHFDHWQHRRVFPTCQGCHPGAQDSTKSIWPSPRDCEECHDGKTEKKIQWSPPSTPRPSNMRFSHLGHAKKAAKRFPGDSIVCTSCHLSENAPWMLVRRPIPQRCLKCHEIRAEHLAAANTACRTCHLTLPEATTLPRERVAAFPTPPAHLEPSFATAHGKLAEPPPADTGAHFDVAPSCATCHARDFCIQCHVNAPEVPVIQALAPDARSLAIEAKLETPASHDDPAWIQQHGKRVHSESERCATCHTQESCLTCHVAQPGVAVAMHLAGPGRGPGAEVHRRRPSWHGDDFTDRHASAASASAKSCNACHARAECLDCHRPNAGSPPAYHPAGFLARHPASAYARATSCAECHNERAFCTDCHEQSGLVANGKLQGGYHDGKQNFILGHGPAARQGLESCVSCHAERDCLTCHSALGGRHFNPHGPDFDAERMRKHNPQMCTVCHGALIPEQ